MTLTRLPPECLNRHAAILATSDAGKTYAARGEVEQLLDAGERVCVIDPAGAWFGLRLQLDGETPSRFSLPIFGGVGPKGRPPKHHDIALGATMGERLAETIADGDFSCIIDVSRMSVADRTRFLADFGEGLSQSNRRKLHLVIDEAHLAMPQGRVMDFESARMLHAYNNLVAVGRNFGIRVLMLSQRPAKLHKDSLTLVQTLVAMFMTAPQDTGAVKDWIKDAAEPAKAKEIIASLPSLQVGEGWVWAPRLGVLERIKFAQNTTFDSSATPEGDDGDDRAEHRLGELDLAQLQGLLTDHVADPPVTSPTYEVDEAKLQTAREGGYTDGIAEGRRLEREDYSKLKLSALPEVQKLIRLAEQAGRRTMAEALASEFTGIVRRAVADSSGPLALRPQDSDLPSREEMRTTPLSLPRSRRAPAATFPASEPALEAPPADRPTPPAAPTSGDPKGGAALRLVLTLRGAPRPVTAEELAVLTGLIGGSGYMNAGLKELRDGGWTSSDEAGRLSTGSIGPAATITAREVFDGWVNRLAADKGAGAGVRLLRHIWDHPGLDRAELCAFLGILPTSGYANAGFAALKRSPLVEQLDSGRWVLSRLIRELQDAEVGR